MKDSFECDKLQAPTSTADRRSEGGTHFGLGVGFSVVGLGILANQLGGTQIDWFFSAILIGYGAYYLHQAWRY